MNPYQLKEYIKAIDDEQTVDLSVVTRHFTNLVEIARLADIINAEFMSDPMSVQCFDLRIVAQLKEALILLEAD
ncbi:hypothetical protein LCGC14_1909160 [marine sediment metagenome]|uniref:Uncharacterized protein n=1 Tax=marine sediment metagenome TaxID=412755 RepID=A0A0F9I842_9ZZZZ